MSVSLTSRCFFLVILDARRHRRADLIIENDIFALIQAIVFEYFSPFFMAIILLIDCDNNNNNNNNDTIS